MSWHTGTATDYLDLLDDLMKIVQANSLATATVAVGGSGYIVGEILTLTGGTFSPAAATCEVLTLSGSAVATVRIKTGGAYTVDPSTPSATSSSASGINCTLTTTFSTNGWTEERRTQEAVSAAIGAGGTGYTVGDNITAVGGVGSAVAAVFNVDTISGGGGTGPVTGVSLVTAGDYEEVPSNDVSVTGGTGGDDCELTVTWQDATTQNQVVILEGSGGGTDEILVGIKTFDGTEGFDHYYNWGVVGMTGFNSTLEFHEQAGISPGFDSVGDPDGAGGSFLLLKTSDAFNMSYWISVTPRRIILVAKVEDGTYTNYASCHMGWMNPFGTSSEFPYPIYIAASSPKYEAFYLTTGPQFTGLTDPWSLSGHSGPAFYRRQDQVWQQVANSIATDGGSPTRSVSRNYTVYPAGLSTIEGETVDRVVADGGLDWEDVVPSSGLPGTQSLKLMPTPNTTNDVNMLVPATVIASDDDDGSIDLEILGELDNVFWFSAESGETAEDTMTIGSTVYRIFPNGNQSSTWHFMAIEES